MTRTLTFGPCKDAAGEPTGECKRFALFVNLFITGGNILHFNPQSGPTARTRDDRAKEAKIVKAWKAISDPTDPEPARKLKPEGGTITLDQKGHELVMKYLVAAPAGTQDSDTVDELIDWASAAEKDKTDPSA